MQATKGMVKFYSFLIIAISEKSGKFFQRDSLILLESRSNQGVLETFIRKLRKPRLKKQKHEPAAKRIMTIPIYVGREKARV